MSVVEGMGGVWAAPAFIAENYRIDSGPIDSVV